MKSQKKKNVNTDLKSMNDVILKCYKECPRTQKLHNDFSGYSLNECVNDILEKLDELEDYKFVKVEKEELIGYFATTKIEDNDILFTFFVRPKFRNKKDLTFFWNKIKEEFKGDFLAPIFSSNEPAKRFLKRNNGTEVKLTINSKDTSFFEFTGE